MKVEKMEIIKSISINEEERELLKTITNFVNQKSDWVDYADCLDCTISDLITQKICQREDI